MPSFQATGAQLTQFFKLATINGNIETILVDLKKGHLMTSALVEDGKHCWALCDMEVGVHVGQGSFVIQSTDIKKLNLKSKVEYACSFDKEKLTLQSEKTRTTIQLINHDAHIESDTSSYVPPVEHLEGSPRWFTKLVETDDGWVPMAPDKSGPLEKDFSFMSADFKDQLKLAGSFDTKTVQIEMKEGAPGGILMAIVDDSVAHAQKIEAYYHNEESFDYLVHYSDPFRDIINLAGPKFSMRLTPQKMESGLNFGAWIRLEFDDTTAYYWLASWKE